MVSFSKAATHNTALPLRDKSFISRRESCETDIANAGRGLHAIPAESFAMSQPEDVDVNEILFRPTSQEI